MAGCADTVCTDSENLDRIANAAEAIQANLHDLSGYLLYAIPVGLGVALAVICFYAFWKGVLKW